MVEAGGAGFTSYNVENDKLFQRNIDRALKELSDLRTPFKMIANDFYKSEMAIFKLQGPGKYPDFKSEKSKKAKKKDVGFVISFRELSKSSLYYVA